jgi:hypothetical protein
VLPLRLPFSLDQPEVSSPNRLVTGVLISTPWNEDTVDPYGGRHRRITNDDLRALGEALA